MDKFIICVFATENTPYIQIAQENIIPSLQEHKIDYDFCIVPNLRSWQKNTSYKATFALSMLDKHINKDIVLLDADSRVFNYPTLFNEIPQEYNIAAHILDHYQWYQRGMKRQEFLTGTLFLRNNNRAREIVNAWIKGCTNSFSWEQIILEEILRTEQEPIFQLPLSYCYLNTLPNGNAPYIVLDKLYIVHYQASRINKRLIR
jgi:hypothetical protein